MSYRRSVPFAKAAIRDRLAAIPTLSETLVSYGNPSPTRWPREVVIVGAMSNWGHTHTAALTQEREEYDIEIMVNVTGPVRNSNETNEARAYEIADAIHDSLEEWTRTSPGSLVTGAWGHVDVIMPEAAHDIEGVSQEERDASVILTVHVLACLINYGD